MHVCIICLYVVILSNSRQKRHRTEYFIYLNGSPFFFSPSNSYPLENGVLIVVIYPFLIRAIFKLFIQYEYYLVVLCRVVSYMFIRSFV